MSELDEIRARLEAATPGPWTYDGMHNEICTPQSEDGYWLIVSECRSAPDQVRKQDERGDFFDPNFDLIAHMREDMALLLAVVDAFLDKVPLEETVATLRELGHTELADAWEPLT